MPNLLEVAEAVLEITDETQRRNTLDRVCEGDPEFRAKVERFLAAKGAADQFFSECTAAIVDSQDDPDSSTTAKREQSASQNESNDDPVGSKIGPYKLLQKIGEGGCGVVYMAEQEKPVRRRVALKVIKLGMDTKSVIARFEAERQALALMDHPNIARVLDAGATETGRPYFVMELVHGVRITEYCDVNKLATPRRLELFVQVCLAIQHAHQKGVIHRDIKPSNILVTMLDGVPIPKVIDFGIAKAIEEKLTDKTIFTMYGHFIGTPAYMSPEQAQMSAMDVDTRSDIYSLGVLLYELLTGRTPFDQRELMAAGIDEMRRTLTHCEPHRPSTRLDILTPEELTTTAARRLVEPSKLRLELQGDLDWIVMKALEKDRSRRYQTANGLAQDVRRCLENEPVLARPPSRLYRLQKLIRRNKVVFALSAAVVLALVIGMGASLWLWLRERDALQRMLAAEEQKIVLQEETARLEHLRQAADEKRIFAEATAFFRQGKLAKADELLDEIPRYKADPEDAAMFRAVGNWDANQGRWTKALSRFEVLVQINFQETTELLWDDLRLGTVLVEQGELVKYAQFRKGVMARYAGTRDPVVASHAVRICLLGEADSATLEALKHLDAVSVQAIETSAGKIDRRILAWCAYSAALMEYRRGNHAAATNWCGRALAFASDIPLRTARVELVQALALAQSGQLDEARRLLVATRREIKPIISGFTPNAKQPPDIWFDWVGVRILLREATNLIEGESAGDD